MISVKHLYTVGKVVFPSPGDGWYAPLYLERTKKRVPRSRVVTAVGYNSLTDLLANINRGLCGYACTSSRPLLYRARFSQEGREGETRRARLGGKKAARMKKGSDL